MKSLFKLYKITKDMSRGLKKFFVYCLVIVSFVTGYLFCEDMFLSACIDIGIRNNKMLQVKKEAIELSRRELLAATREFLPMVILQRRISRGKTIQEEYQAEDLWIRAMQRLYEGGRLSALHRYYSLAVDKAKTEYIEVKEELVSQIKQAYYQYVGAVVEEMEIGKLLEDIENYYKILSKEFNAKAISELEFNEGKNFRDKVENFYIKANKNKLLYERQLLVLLNIEKIKDIPYPVSGYIISSPLKEITYNLEELKKLTVINNPKLKKLKLELEMNQQKRKVAMSKGKPKFFFEGSYGRSGEAYVTEPLELATVWSGMIRLVWTFGGSSLESSYHEEHSIPREILDVSQRIDNKILDVKIGLFDDLRYFVEKKEAEVSKSYAEAEYQRLYNEIMFNLEKSYYDYYLSLLDTKVAHQDYEIKKWRLEVVKRQREVYAATTLDVMSAMYSFSEALTTYTKSVVQNYVAVSQLEMLVLLPLR
ncbi:MAG: TolC family protein [Nitrososphaeria archaeon]